MKHYNLQRRTQQFALQVIKFVQRLPRGPIGRVVGGQLLRCGTSVGANYRSAAGARSRADFIAKMKIVEEEADESLYWLALLHESGTVDVGAVATLADEASQLLAITVASIKTARRNA